MKNKLFMFLLLCCPLFVLSQNPTTAVGHGNNAKANDSITRANNANNAAANAAANNGQTGYGVTIPTFNQVGIGTETPKGKLHVAGDLALGSDQFNRKFVFHSRTNGAGDFLHITNDNSSGKWDWYQGIILRRGGNVRIGTYEHDAKLTLGGSLRIIDGTQGNGKVLISDANRKATWKDPIGSPPLALGDSYAGGIIFYLDETGNMD